MDYKLPTEIIYQIVAEVVSEYLDDVIPQPSIIRRLRLRRGFLTPSYRKDEVISILDHEIGELPIDTIDPYENNPIIPLLETSYLVRETTLLVLSDALGIPKDEKTSRLTMKPWSRIQAVRQLYGNYRVEFEDVVRAAGGDAPTLIFSYGVLGLAEWSLWYTIVREIQYNPRAGIEPTEYWTLPGRVVAAIPSTTLRQRVRERVTHYNVYGSAALLLKQIKYTVGNVHRFLTMYPVEMQRVDGWIAEHNLLWCLQAFGGGQSDHGIIPPAVRARLPRGSFLKAIEDLDYEDVKPRVELIAYETAQMNPEYEPCRETALRILQDWPPRPWEIVQRVTPGQSTSTHLE